MPPRIAQNPSSSATSRHIPEVVLRLGDANGRLSCEHAATVQARSWPNAIGPQAGMEFEVFSKHSTEFFVAVTKIQIASRAASSVALLGAGFRPGRDRLKEARDKGSTAMHSRARTEPPDASHATEVRARLRLHRAAPSTLTSAADPPHCAQRWRPPSSGQPARQVAFPVSRRCKASSAAASDSAASGPG